MIPNVFQSNSCNSGALHSSRLATFEVAGISKSYGATRAVDDVTFTGSSAESIALTGGNGSGKSTLLRILVGALLPDSGSFIFNTVPLGDGKPRRAKETGIEMVFQDSGYCPGASILENLFLGGEPHGPLGFVRLRQMRHQAREIVQRLGLPLRELDVQVRELSAGQQKAVAICRALLSKPRLLLLDEATANLGVREQEMVMNTFAQLKTEGIGFVCCTHSPDEVLAFADRLLVMRQGKLSEDRPVKGISRAELAIMMSA